MPESFLHLSSTEQSQILRGLAAQLSRAPNILEKDVCMLGFAGSVYYA